MTTRDDGGAAHPFTPGTAVMVHSGYEYGQEGVYREDTVLKLHKTGRFTLASEPSQQWSASRSHFTDDRYWVAHPTHGHGGWGLGTRKQLRLLDDKAREEKAASEARVAHAKRCHGISDQFRFPKNISAELSATVSLLLAERNKT